MAYSFDDVVYSLSLIMFVVVLICVFAYEFFSIKTTKTVTKESSISDSSGKKGKRYKKQSDKFA